MIRFKVENKPIHMTVEKVAVVGEGAYERGYSEGYSDGYKVGYSEGETKGKADGEVIGYGKGYTVGHAEGQSEGYKSGYDVGYADGYAKGKVDGYAEGHTVGYDEGKQDGIEEGYASGYEEGKADGSTIALDALMEGATDLYSEATYIQRASLFQNKSFLTSLNFPCITDLNGNYIFYGCSGLKTVSMPLLKNLPVQTFYNCTLLEKLNFPSVERTSGQALNACKGATEAYLPNCKYLGDNTFVNCSALEYVEIGSLSSTSTIYRQCFYKCSALTTLVLRVTSFKNLENVNVFAETPIESGTGYIYIPSSLIPTFQNATNWSTFQFRALEDYTVDGTVTGEFDRTKI